MAPSPVELVPLWEVVETSFDEAEFLWRSWQSGLHAHARDLKATWFWTEDRLLGALDGVGLGGARVVQDLLMPALSSPHTSEVQVAVHALALMPGLGHEVLRPALRIAKPCQRLPVQRALQLLTTPAQIACANELLDGLGEDAVGWRMACRSFRREPSPVNDVERLAHSPQSVDRALALQAARCLPPRAARKFLLLGLNDPDVTVAATAVESGLIHGLPAAWQRCRSLMADHSDCGAPFWWACVAAAVDRKLLMSLLASPSTFAPALAALGFLGTREAADVALETMQAQSETNLRLAAEAFCAVTGLDLVAAKLVAPEAALAEEPLTFEQDNLQANLVPTADELLPLPDVRGVARWWQTQRPSFETNIRYIGGRPLSPRALYEALARGPMRRRHVLAFELAARTQGACDVQTRAFYAFQKRQLAQVHAQLFDQAAPFAMAGFAS